MSHALDPMTFACGRSTKNRLMLAPLTKCQSHQDGRLSDEELHWLTLRARGGFGVVTTCASHVQAVGQARNRPGFVASETTPASTP